MSDLFYIDRRIIGMSQTIWGAVTDNNTLEHELSIFLCGGASKANNSIRRAIGSNILSKNDLFSSWRYSVHYPEDIFFDLLLGHEKFDLLSLENILASSVRSIIILLQSHGTIAELGAFANHPELKDKLIVVQDSKYKLQKSFITKGPVEYLIKQTDSEVIFDDYSDVDKLSERIVKVLRKSSKKSKFNKTITNPLLCYRFILGLITIFNPIPEKYILHILTQINGGAKSGDSMELISKISLSSLMLRNKIYKKGGLLYLTKSGIDEEVFSGKSFFDKISYNNKLRLLKIDAVNCSYRGKVNFFRCSED